jgi:hypothetical protein
VVPTGTPVPVVGETPVLPAELVPAAQLPGQSVKSVPCKDLSELRQATIESLNRDRGILASGIEKSLPWEWAEPSAAEDATGEKLLIPVRDPLTAELLKKEYPLIRQILGELWGKPLALEVIVSSGNAGEAVAREPELPPQVELVRQMFRGTVVKISSMERKDAN